MIGDIKQIDAQLHYASCVGDLLLRLGEDRADRGDAESSMRYAHVAACVYSRQNKFLFSPRVEEIGRRVGAQLVLEPVSRVSRAQAAGARPTALHVLTEALSAGGLTAMATRWIAGDARITCGHVALLDCDQPAPTALVEAVARAGGSVHTLPGEESFLNKAKWLRSLADKIADYVVLHIDVSDVVCASAFGCPGGPPVILVNHTAHTFWVGVGYADRVANCRGSNLEQVWAERYRGLQRHCTIPIPLNLSQSQPLDALPRGRNVTARMEVRAALALPAPAKVLVTVGARFKYVPLPNLDFLKILETVLQSNQEAHLLVVGFQPDLRWRQASARTGGRIRVLGTLSQAELARVYMAGDVYVEGFPFGTTTALLEAAYNGVAVMLAPLDCPPPYSTDGIAIDGTVVRATSVDEYIIQLQSLIEDTSTRLHNAYRIRTSVAQHHAGQGWTAHLRAAVASLPAAHELYAFGTPAQTPESIYGYWTRSSPNWTWSYDETLEHMLIRTLRLGLMPRLDHTSRMVLNEASRAAGAVHMPIWLVAFICNAVLPVVPPPMREKLFRAASFLCRPNLHRRLRQRISRLFGHARRTGGAYEEYRNASPTPIDVRRRAVPLDSSRSPDAAISSDPDSDNAPLRTALTSSRS